jgi:G3E family GTPase
LIVRINPAAQIVDGTRTCDLAAMLTGVRTLSPSRQASSPAYDLGNRVRVQVHENMHAADHSHGIDSVSVVLAQPIEWSAFAIWLTLLLHAHGDQILRFKALLRVAGWPALVALDGVHHLIHPPTHVRARPDSPPASQLVVIAQGLQVSRIGRSLHRFLGLIPHIVPVGFGPPPQPSSSLAPAAGK